MLSYYPPSLRERYNPKVWGGFKVYEGESPFVLKRIMLNYTWSPIVWKNGRRRKDHFLYSDYLALDFDDYDAPTMEEFNERTICDMWRIIGTTKSHQVAKGDNPPCDRYRALLRWEKRITCVREYEHNVKRAVERFGADQACIDGARLIFPCTEIYASEQHEDLYDWDVEAPESEEQRKARIEKYVKKSANFKRSGGLNSYCRKWLNNVIPEGKRNDTIYMLGCDLYRSGMPFEQAIEAILASPTYEGRDIDQSLRNEIEKTLGSGYVRAEKGLREENLRT